MPPLLRHFGVRRLLAVVAAVLLCSPLLVAAPAHAQGSVADEPILERISGENGTIISAAVSRRFFVDTDTVVLARADNYPDALAGAPLARLRNAPILLVPQTAPLPATIFNELDRLDPTTAIILGGTAAIDDSLAQAVTDLGISVQRIGGPTRFHTAAMIGDIVVRETGTSSAYLVRGGHPSPTGGWPDAVAVSALAAKQGRPILLSDGEHLNDPTVELLDREDITDVDIIGGVAAVAESVEAALRDTGRDVVRIGGRTRFETSVAIAEAGFSDNVDLRNVFLVSGGNYADALATSVPAGGVAGTMLVVDGRNWDISGARQMLLDRFGEIEQIRVVGSADSVPVTIDHELVDQTVEFQSFDTAGAVRIPVGENIQRFISTYPPGTHFLIASGVHRGQEFFPRDGDRFTGEPGAILNGAMIMDPAQAGIGENGVFVLPAPSLPTPEVDPVTEMIPGREREAMPNELWAGHMRLRHVNTPGEVNRPGTWYYNYDNAELFMFDDPRSLPGPLELSLVPEAIRTTGATSAKDVVIRNLTFTHYANIPSRGVLDLGDASNWDVGHITVIDNHGVGVRTGPGLHLHNSRIVRNGQMGIVGTDSDFAETKAPVTIEGNEVSFNGELGFNWGWEGGSIKFGSTNDLRLIGNWVHNHVGPGPWMDEFGVNTVFAENLVEHNGINGLMHEISTGATIVDNIVRNNGLLAFGDLGSGVWVSNSPDVEIGWNVIEGNRLPINAQTSPPQAGREAMPIENLLVHHNDIRIDHLLPGMRVTSDATYVFRDGNNRFQDNRYRTRLDYPFHFWWGDVYDIPEWQATLGFDTAGEFVDINEAPRTFAERPGFSLRAYGAN